MPHQPGAMCPSCGRFVGPLDKCPYCGADIKKRIPLKAIRLACLALALAGVALLVYAASGTATPTTKINAIGATMNYAYVRLDGIVTRGPLYNPDTQALSFYIADETGEIQAAAFRDVTGQLVAQNKVPTAGDKISVEGTLRIRDDFASITVRSADKLALIPPTPGETKISEIGHDDEFHYVAIAGDVREIRHPFQGLTIFTLGDDSGELDIAVTADVEKLYGELAPIALGDSLRVKGIVTFFRDSPQLVLRHPVDFEKLAADNAPTVTSKIGELDASRLNQRVQVSGQVTRVSQFSQGVRATVADGTGEITLLLWENVYDRIANAKELTRGAHVSALGKLTEYHGDPEIQPARPQDVSISAPVAKNAEAPTETGTFDSNGTALPDATSSPDATAQATNSQQPTREPTRAPVERAISELTQADEGTRVTVEGKITRASAFSQGMRFTLDDEAGSITLIIWSDLWSELADRDALKQGAKLRVTGEIDVYNGALEIIPTDAADVKLVEAAPTLLARAIGSISTDDLDSTVFIRGTIAELADFSAGKYVTLQDESGKILVTLFENAVTPGVRAGLDIGLKVSVRGRVNVYHGKLEIVADEFQVD